MTQAPDLAARRHRIECLFLLLTHLFLGKDRIMGLELLIALLTLAAAVLRLAGL